MIVISLFFRLQVQHKGSEHINVCMKIYDLTILFIGKVHLTGEWGEGRKVWKTEEKMLVNEK